MDTSKTKILIAGEGGQGIQTIGKILSRAAFAQGLKTLYVPNFGVEQRGGVSVAFVQISEQELSYPKFEKADLLVVLNERAIKRSASYIGPATKIISNNSLIAAEILPANNNVTEIDATNIANKEFTPQTLSILVLGAILPFLPLLKKEYVKKAIGEQLGSKFKAKPELEALNYKALERGIALT
ncbi:ketoisovalerate oxidoreductase [bacterium (Candidatus Torokbacteria) CG09_land_8_20_14_0_10_42_11]|nr:MAG: ketoisovalerate oxidoreductase [bacterium (Candidatus Torokbacteria) CG09_land_8_20_14_0_10_42_11]